MTTLLLGSVDEKEPIPLLSEQDFSLKKSPHTTTSNPNNLYAPKIGNPLPKEECIRPVSHLNATYL